MMVMLDRCNDSSKEIAKRYADQVVTGAWERPKGLRRHAGLDPVCLSAASGIRTTRSRAELRESGTAPVGAPLQSRYVVGGIAEFAA